VNAEAASAMDGVSLFVRDAGEGGGARGKKRESMK
jgi:hypothetical protein